MKAISVYKSIYTQLVTKKPAPAREWTTDPLKQSVSQSGAVWTARYSGNME